MVKKREKIEEKHLSDVMKSAIEIQDFLWEDRNKQWDLKRCKRMLRKRLEKIEEIDLKKSHAKVELKKRLLQNAAISLNFLIRIDSLGLPKKNAKIPDHLKKYKRK